MSVGKSPRLKPSAPSPAPREHGPWLLQRDCQHFTAGPQLLHRMPRGPNPIPLEGMQVPAQTLRADYLPLASSSVVKTWASSTRTW